MIEELKENQIFCFGSNLLGKHDGGAAKQACEKFGAIYGQPIGIQGNSYAIPTLGFEMEKLPLEEIRDYLSDFVTFAKDFSEKEFLLTPIGQGIARFTVDEIKSILPQFPKNVILVGKWD